MALCDNDQYCLSKQSTKQNPLSSQLDFQIIDKPESKSQSKVQAPNPKIQIHKGKGELGLRAVSKILSGSFT